MKRLLLFTSSRSVPVRRVAFRAARSRRAGGARAAKPAALFANLGSHRHPIATSSPEAQKFFDQGVVLLFGFNHEEAIRFFERAARARPEGRDAALGHGARARRQLQRSRAARGAPEEGA